jgi:transcriptional regulator with XRE-family HTH domain
MHNQRFCSLLLHEWNERRRINPRYSLRAFAIFLGADHSTVSQILRGTRPVPTRQIRSWSKKLGLSREEAAAFVLAEQLPDERSSQRARQLRHWSAEAMQIVSDRTHWEIVRLARRTGFRFNSQHVAEETSSSVDHVNIALSRLLRLGLITMEAPGRVKLAPELARISEAGFRALALATVRKKAAESRVKLNPISNKK